MWLEEPREERERRVREPLKDTGRVVARRGKRGWWRILWRIVAHNCHIKTKCSHQIQITHIKFKSLTANSNHSQQIQIAHSKFNLLTANYKSTTANYKSFTSNSSRSHQIQIAYSKYKSLTANTNTVSVKGRRTADCRLQTKDQGKKQTKGKTKDKMQARG